MEEDLQEVSALHQSTTKVFRIFYSQFAFVTIEILIFVDVKIT
jgi:hypothetical protein